ncbi:MAG: pyruvate phosphate dikinase [Betaproteobacteria bacterium]|nr:pyruvate phosphate dikinase [Betaproteobacteria bacterium]
MMNKTLSKARMLIELQPRVTRFLVPDLAAFTVDQLKRLSEAELGARISGQFGSSPLIVRSSAGDEDGQFVSKAGAYESVLGVMSDDSSALGAAVRTVMESYQRNQRSGSSDEVIFQRLIERPAMSGVVFTHDLNTGAPYYVINYDDVSGFTNTVTSGGGEYANRTLYIHRSAVDAIRSERFKRLIGAVQELEQLLGSQFLDIEFALDEALQPYLLQVRAITTQPNWNRAVARRIDAELRGIQTFVRERLRPAHGVFGQTTVLGQMPDWNPAEMIGRAPRALALSMYRTLITDRAWWRARERMGYASPAGRALMVSLAGQPFIDTRLSFHSYLPAELPAPIATKLVDAWVARLRAHPELHDKIEFEVAITAFSLDIDGKLERLVGENLLPDERCRFRDALRRLTLPLLRGEGAGCIASAMEKVECLAGKQLPAGNSGLCALLPMIEDCIRFGTEPFAVLARHGFIARTLLLSLVERGLLSGDDVACFQAGVRTVASDLVDDMRALQAGSLPRDTFMARYGHLRPGTYDILSPRYDQMEDFVATGGGGQEGVGDHRPQFALAAWQRAAIDAMLCDEGLNGVDSECLLAYCAAAIAGREYGKFVFTRSVSAMLELIADFGERHGLSREEMSHVPLGELLDVALSSGGALVEERLRSVAEREAERHVLTSAIRLPQVLYDEAGVHVVPFQVSQPNFITGLKVTAEVVLLDTHQTAPTLSGCIVLIENADPGYDWIFAQRIAGLITKYGGANSHMAIRCAEFGIPAAIGCGEQRFEAFLQVRRISLDCSTGLITPLH